jgi:hypothetical protein
MTLEQARHKFAQQLTLRLDSADLPANFCDVLEKILAPYCRQAQTMSATGTNGSHIPVPTPGQGGAEPAQTCRVMIDLQRSTSKGCIMLGEQWQVTPADELIERLKSEFGRTQVGLKYNKSAAFN